MKNKDKNEKLRFEQLLSEDGFLRYCTYDEQSTPKIEGKHIYHDFLRALEKDELVIPLLKDKKKIKNEDGTDKEVDLNYYSPFQIFLISELSRNEINEDGLPVSYSVGDKKYQNAHNSRYVSWGGGSEFNASFYKNPPYKRKSDFNVYDLAKDFHNLIKFIHTFDIIHSYEKVKPERNRYYRQNPSFQYNFEPISKNIKEELKKYNLTINKIKKVKYQVAYHASKIDPLELWYYYLDKHPQWRKDMLKGKANLAQDLYGFCKIIDDIVEIATNEKPIPLFEFIHPDIKPMGHSGIEYASGIDLIMLKDITKKLGSWLKSKKNIKILNLISNVINNGKKLDKMKEELEEAQKELDDFERRYGEKRYVGGFMREVYPEKKIKLNDLDANTKKYVESRINHERERGIEGMRDGKTYLYTNYDDVVELWKKGKKKEALDKHIGYETEYAITGAIENSLDDIGRKISGVSHWISRALWIPREKIKRDKEIAQPQAWAQFYKEYGHDRNDPSYIKARIDFGENGIKKITKSYDDELKQIENAQIELDGFGHKTRLIYCANCKKRLIQLHHGHGDKLANPQQICDKCLMDTVDYRSIKNNEWKCESCGKLIYKFAHGNILSDVLFNTASATIRLNYGEVIIEATCPNKKCKRKQHRLITWGWKP